MIQPPTARGAPARHPASALPAGALFELRSYRTQPGRRDDLVAMFEAHFLDAYETAGATIVMTCRHLDDANRWVWMRAFPGLAQREAALQAFYAGAAWRERAKACNATIADVGDAWLLGAEAGAPPAGSGSGPGSMIEATIYELRPDAAAAFAAFHAVAVTPLLLSSGDGSARWRWTASTPPALADAPRDPRRPVRQGHWFVTLAGFDDQAALAHHRRELAASAAWRALQPRLAAHLRRSVQTWRLQPTPRSALR